MIALILAAVSGALSLKVPINTDMTKYLPADSRMKQGIDLMKEEFSDLALPNTIRVMFGNLAEEREEEVLNKLKALEYASSAVKTARKEKDGKTYTLFTVSTDYTYQSEEELALEHGIPGAFPGDEVTVVNDNASGMEIPVFIFAVALVILLGVLFVLCGSYIEPFLFLFTIGIAILLNMGTNIVLGSVSVTTYSISAILQLVLSMDYSIILMNRYRQEKWKGGEKTDAMERALIRAFSSIASSGFTTLVGLTMLVFMRFQIGKDIGLVLAKGVFLSMVCCLMLLPALILLFDRLVEKTAKPALRIHTRALARFSFRLRYVLAAGFAVLFFGAWYMDSLAGTSYSLSREDPIADIFPSDNPVVLLYDNGDEAAAEALAISLESDPNVRSVSAYSTTIGRKLTAEEMTDYLREMMADGGGAYAGMLGDAEMDFDPSAMSGFADSLNGNTMRSLYGFYGMLSGEGKAEKLSIDQIFAFLKAHSGNPLIRAAIGQEGADAIDKAGALMDLAKSKLIGPKHSIMMISTSLPVEGEETSAFLSGLEKSLTESMGGGYYTIGNSVMNVEMQASFGRELLTISLLTAAAIFVVVLVTFRNLVVPIVLVLLVQCGVFLTVATTWLLGYKMYYLALLIVQCILMGATVDYGILYANYYRENRANFDIKRALGASYEGAMHTILTSSLFMIFGTGVIGFSPADPTITQICKSISIGAASATLLVIFVLPGLLAALDRLVVGKKAI